MKLGYSMSPQILLGQPSSAADAELLRGCGGAAGLLNMLKNQGIGWIELRYLPMTAKDKEHEKLCHLIWESGLKLSVHGKLSEDGSGMRFVDIYPSLRETLKFLTRYQPDIVLTLHAFVSLEETIAELEKRSTTILQRWISSVAADGLPLCFGLELDHFHPNTALGPGGTCEGIVRMVEHLNSPTIGITWDMGHYYSNLKQGHGMTHLQNPPHELLPPKSFLEKTIHTHIHGVGEAGAHYPLTETDCLPLEKYIAALQESGFQGIYNLELRYSTFTENYTPAEHVAQSIQRLKNAYRYERGG